MWVLEGDSIRARSEMFVLAGPSIYALLVGVHVAMIVINGLFARALAVSRHAALRESEIRAWHLRKLLSLGE
jgi:hypothetical protein